MKPTYKQQFDRLTAAYINNEVNPFSPCACFVGNLLEGREEWAYFRSFKKDPEKNLNHVPCLIDEFGAPLFSHAAMTLRSIWDGFYSPLDIVRLEGKFLSYLEKWWDVSSSKLDNNQAYEQDLFIAFEATLEELKQIHIEKGEVIEETPVFTKRQLQKV